MGSNRLTLLVAAILATQLILVTAYVLSFDDPSIR